MREPLLVALFAATLAYGAEENGKSCARYVALFAPDVPVHADPDLLRRGDKEGQTANAVTVSVPGEPYSSMYNRTNRGRDTLVFFYEPKVISSATWRGKKVLDVGCGGGKWVEELRKDGVEAYGLDIALTEAQKEKVYRSDKNEGKDGLFLDAKHGQGHFVGADGAKTGLASEQFDAVFQTYGTFEYDLYPEEKRPRLVEQMKEFHRLLKKGGKLYLSPQYEGWGMERLEKILKEVPGLRLERLAPADPNNDDAASFVEITRID